MNIEQYIGVDMAKRSFHVCFDDTTNIKKYANTNSGITRFFKDIEKRSVMQLTAKPQCKQTVHIGVESTSVYHLLLCMRSKEEGHMITLINPLITKRHTQTQLRGTKNDPLDARLVRWCLMQGHGYLFKETPQTLTLKHLVREREFLSRLKRILKTRQQDILYKEACIGETVFAVHHELLGFVKEKTAILERELKQYRKEEQILLQSIPGIGPLTAVTCISEVQDINRFKKSKHLIASIGTDPVTRQSGSSIDKYRRISKRGNKLLRTRLYNAASVAVLHPNQFKEYFQKKKDQGKPYRVALVATMNKMARVIHAVWTKKEPYKE